MRGASVVSIQRDGIERAAEDVTDLLVALTTIEGRVLRLVREGDLVIPHDDLAAELTLLSRDLRRYYRRAVDLAERRDLSFRTQRKLRRIQEHCIWLYRKAYRERAFFAKLALEGRLQEIISKEAFDVYQQLVYADDEERRVVTADDVAMAARLLTEPEDPPAT